MPRPLRYLQSAPGCNFTKGRQKLATVSYINSNYQLIAFCEQMLPAFSKRLQQREFDLILVTPLRRRILLKMFAVACFLRAGREKSAYERGVRRLWKSPSLRDIIMDEGFHEDDENVILMKDISKPILFFLQSLNGYEIYTS